MKNRIAIAFVMFTLTSFAQKKVQEVVIQTTAECGSCKERIESKLNYTKGIKFAELDVPSRELTVNFKATTISLKEIKEIVVALGYDADDIKANPQAYQALPACCKVGGMEHMK